jgi:hypothetical protein
MLMNGCIRKPRPKLAEPLVHVELRSSINCQVSFTLPSEAHLEHHFQTNRQGASGSLDILQTGQKTGQSFRTHLLAQHHL